MVYEKARNKYLRKDRHYQVKQCTESIHSFVGYLSIRSYLHRLPYNIMQLSKKNTTQTLENQLRPLKHKLPLLFLHFGGQWWKKD